MSIIKSTMKIITMEITTTEMMITPNSLAHQKEGAQGEEEEHVGGRRKGGLIGTPTPGEDAPIGPSR